MCLKASYTVENSIIIPIFAMIIVVMINLALYLHDCIIVSNAQIRAAIHIELENAEADKARRRAILTDMSDYIGMKSIAYAKNLSAYQQEVLESSILEEKRPVDFIRMTNIFN